jgi:hypothetical protein
MNRKQRRTQASSGEVTRVEDIPLATPSRIPPQANGKTKTLLEIAAERQAELLGTSAPSTRNGSATMKLPRPEDIVQVRIDEKGEIIQDGKPSIIRGRDVEAEETFFDTVLLTITLTCVHLTLSVLAMHQYAEKIEFRVLTGQTLFIALPSLLFALSLFHGHIFPSSIRSGLSTTWTSRVLLLRGLIWVVVANVAGCYLIKLTNDKGYYQVMKDAPSVGTIWVWCVIEMGLAGAVVGVLGPAIYAWWKGFGIF